MIVTHARVLIGLAWSRGQRLSSLVAMLGGAALFSVSLGVHDPDWGIQAVMLLLTAALLVQWRAALFQPSDRRVELPIPLKPQTAQWLTSVLQAGAVGGVTLLLNLGFVFGVSRDLEETRSQFFDHLLLDALVGVALLVPILVLLGRLMRGLGGQREIVIWAGGPALASLSVACIALDLPEQLVYAIWLGMFVVVLIALVLLIARMVGALNVWRQRTQSVNLPLYREGKAAGERLAIDGRRGILRALGWLIASDVVGWSLLWFAFSSWFFQDLGLDAEESQNLVAPLGLAVLLGVRILALGSLLGQVGLVGGLQPWANQPWSLLPLPRATIQRALLQHIAIVALVAIALNVAFLLGWGSATDELMWSPQHVQLRGLIANMVQSMAVLTAIMAMAFMIVGPGLRGRGQLAAVAAGTLLAVLVYLFHMPVPGVAAAYLSTAVANAAAVALLTAGVWAITWRRAVRGRAAPSR